MQIPGGNENYTETSFRSFRSFHDPQKHGRNAFRVRSACGASGASCGQHIFPWFLRCVLPPYTPFDDIALLCRLSFRCPKMKLIRHTAENLSGDHIEPVEIVDWFSQGESCSLQIGETSVVIRFIGRKGRRARIAVTAMPGTNSVLVQSEGTAS